MKTETQYDIFISYSLKDSQFCNELYNDLSKLYDVWVDTEGISGGVDFQLEIEKILKNIKLMVTIISENSLESKWVRREIQFAENLGKPVIPILLNSHLPIGLVEKHYIDFRGDYKSAYAELLDTIVSHIEPKDKKKEEVNRLIGEGVISYLWNDFSKANHCISQAITLNRSLGSKPADFWNTLLDSFKSLNKGEAMAQKYSALISFDEESEFHSYEGDTRMYEWAVWLDTNETVINNIDRVIYYLHETFSSPVQAIRNKGDNFKLTRIGWGTFQLKIRVIFVDNSEKDYYYMLSERNKITSAVMLVLFPSKKHKKVVP